MTKQDGEKIYIHIHVQLVNLYKSKIIVDEELSNFSSLLVIF